MSSGTDPGTSMAPPFAALKASLTAQSPLRAAITTATRAPEPACVARLLPDATLPLALRQRAADLARHLVTTLRARGTTSPVGRLIGEYNLSSQEGIALMCLAEALLRIPDIATRDALIRDKIAAADWRAHLGHSPSLFVNAATWGLLITGRLTATADEAGLATALTKLIARGGEPLIRRGIDMAMRMIGEHFVTGETIAQALANSRRLTGRGFRYSYDMLGEAAVTADDATRYFDAYESAIHAIGRAAAGKGIYEGPGISVKLSALHPRYCRAQRTRVLAELLPRLLQLTSLARHYDIGLNIDAEEADRLELSLDLLEALCMDTSLAGWNGIGFVVQAYQKRAPYVLDFVIDLARRTGHRLMLRLVKGAYWDSEIKRAQLDGLEDFPVFTRKLHTDISYLACAKKLLGASDAIFAQFATHNAHTLSAIHTMAAADSRSGPPHLPRYEFQCLHGMGEPLYAEVVGTAKLGIPCRIYAPVGSHDTLLAYLVRRLLENGANNSFVNRLRDQAIPIETLIADPAEAVATSTPVGTPHPKIALPPQLFAPHRKNSVGVDLANEQSLAALAEALTSNAVHPDDAPIRDSTETEFATAIAQARDFAPIWAATPPAARAALLCRTADSLEGSMAAFIAPLVDEGRKTLPNAIGEIREAVDFLRYYASQARTELTPHNHRPWGTALCISPWNFPLSIFLGQIAAALAAGNTVLAKPAEETRATAVQAVALLHEAGLPRAALHLLQGDGRTGARLVADPGIDAVLFTGSTEVAKHIERQLAQRLGSGGGPIPLIAETGGQNAMIVDSSALAEQVVVDVLASAFDSAGQRCSALRILCLQDDIAERVLTMLHGAMAELTIGAPDRLDTDIGPVITRAACAAIADYIKAMRKKGHVVHQPALPPACRDRAFIAPTTIEISRVEDLGAEIFGPVLHVLRYRRDQLDQLIASLNATGYGLTFGVHSRIDDTIAQICARTRAGNIYVNRNIIGAVVGVQPFGGNFCSGTGPKAGGPLYLHRLLARSPGRYRTIAATELQGPAGECNLYSAGPRGIVLCAAGTDTTRQAQIDIATMSGNLVLIYEPGSTNLATAAFDLVLADFCAAELLALSQTVAARPGPVTPILVPPYESPCLLRERVICTNTTAAGGNAQLMTL